MKKVVIGIAGVKESGKSTVAKLIDEVVFGVREAALADKLKNSCVEAFGVAREDFDDQSKKEVDFIDGPMYLSGSRIRDILGVFNLDIDGRGYTQAVETLGDVPLSSPRRIAQVVGTELLRGFGGSDIHCENMDIPGDVNVISDLRFPNEFNYFSGMEDIDFIPLYISRKEAESKVDENSHVSETSVFEFRDACKWIDNNGTLEVTKEQVVEILKENGVL